MKQLIVRFVRNDEGQDLIEYVLIGTLVSVSYTHLRAHETDS